MNSADDIPRFDGCPAEWTYSAYVDDELDADERHSVDSHLVGCRTCRELVVALAEEMTVIRAALRLEETAWIPRREVAPVQSLAFTGSAAVAGCLACLTAVGWILETAIPSPFAWLISFELTGAFALFFEMVSLFQSEAPAIYQLVVAGGSLLSVAFLLTACFTLTSRRFLTQATALCLLVTGATSLAVLSPSLGYAIELRFDGEAQTVPAGQVVEETWVTSAETVTIEGTLRGDLIVFGDRVVISGVLDGNLLSGARKLEIPGRVTGSIVGIGDRVRISGNVDGNVYGGTSQTTLTESGKIGRDLIGVADGYRVAGQVGRDAMTGSSWIEVPGTVGRDLSVWTEHAEIEDTARIGGDLGVYYETDESAIEIHPNAQIGGETTVESGEHEFGHESEFHRYGHGHFYAFFFVSLAAAFLAGMVLFYLAPGFFQSRIRTGSDLLHALGYGFLTLVAVPVTFVVVALTVIGIPLAVMGIIAFVVAVYLAKIVVAGIIGMSLLGTPEDSDWGGFGLPLLAGLGIVFVASALPYIGGIIGFLAFLTGLGMIVTQLRQRLQA